MPKMVNSCDAAYSSLDVRFTKACDNNCAFCIEKAGIASLGDTDVDAMIHGALNSGIKSMLILGGEPFLLPEKLHTFVSACRPHFDTIYITTALPATFITQEALCYQIIDLIDGLNISMHHPLDMGNNNILEATSRHSRYEILEKICARYSDKVRVGVNLVRGYIDHLLDLCYMLRVLKSHGVKNVKINELQSSSDLYVSFDDIYWKKFPSPYAHGCNMEIKLQAGMNIIVKRSCFVVERSRKATLADLKKVIYKKCFWKPKNKFAVLYEDGTVRNGWERC
jgi:molybdenum cofactor biosynthesis enzyme MoaA